jgi:hypothetical protein
MASRSAHTTAPLDRRTDLILNAAVVKGYYVAASSRNDLQRLLRRHGLNTGRARLLILEYPALAESAPR